MALAAALARVAPGELLVPDRLIKQPALFELFGEHKDVLTPLPDSRFDSTNGRRRLEALYDVKALDAFGPVSRAEVAAAGALVDYIELTQVGRLPRLDRPRRLPPPGSAGAAVEIDPATRRNLELVRTLGGERQGSLLSVIDATVTGAGARALAADLLAPLTDPAAINARLDAVGFFVAATRLRDVARAALRRCPDIERPLSRLSVERGGPRDLAAIRDALAQAQALRVTLASQALASQALAGQAPGADQGPADQGPADQGPADRGPADQGPADRGPADQRPAELAALPPRLAGAVQDLGFHETLVERLTRALGPEMPLLARDGGFVAAGYNDELDGQRELRDESRRLIAGLQAGYVEMIGVPSLKIRHNNVLGYYVEVTAAHGDKLLQRGGGDGPFIHRQTMANAMRFTTVELAELQDKINRAADRAVAIELSLFADLVGEVLARAEEIVRTARALAVIDVAGALAEVAVERRYCRPVVDDSLAFAITAGRHPVVEAALAGADGGAFVANDCTLAGDARLWLVTGPNMAGKSTFLRQNALIAALAQMGAYVPAEAAHIGVVDRLFSRVGAADDLARGRSTFMVEMVETAMILNHATDRSLVILHEIGRGTATFDGLSIAWATVEQLHEVNRCRTLFATHYHELTSLAARLAAVSCHSMRVKEWQGDVVFLHEVAPGTADRSYGIHVARLAGLPLAAVARAEEVLALLEQGDQGSALTRLAEDLPLFQAAAQVARAGAAPAGAAAGKVSALEAALGDINPDALSPREALELIYRLKDLVNG